MIMNINRFEELSGMAITNKQAEGVKLYMEIEDLINETKKAYKSFKNIISDYHAHEADAKTETKILMLINKWESPFIACNELLKRIETNEKFLKNICKASGTTLKKIGYTSIVKKAGDLLQVEQNK